MLEMTEKEIEEAVAHDMKLWLESKEERGIHEDDDPQPGQNRALDARLELLEARVEARVQAVRADLMRWTLLLFCAAVLAVALVVRI